MRDLKRGTFWKILKQLLIIKCWQGEKPDIPSSLINCERNIKTVFDLKFKTKHLVSLINHEGILKGRSPTFHHRYKEIIKSFNSIDLEFNIIDLKFKIKYLVSLINESGRMSKSFNIIDLKVKT